MNELTRVNKEHFSCHFKAVLVYVLLTLSLTCSYLHLPVVRGDANE